MYLPRCERRGVAAGHSVGPEPVGSPESSLRDSQTSLHSGQTGNFSGARLGTQTLPHKATTGVPITIASVSLSLSTKCENRSWSPSSVGTVRSSWRTSVSTAVCVPNPILLTSPTLRGIWLSVEFRIHRSRGVPGQVAGLAAQHVAPQPRRVVAEHVGRLPRDDV